MDKKINVDFYELLTKCHKSYKAFIEYLLKQPFIQYEKEEYFECSVDNNNFNSLIIIFPNRKSKNKFIFSKNDFFLFLDFFVFNKITINITSGFVKSKPTVLYEVKNWASKHFSSGIEESVESAGSKAITIAFKELESNLDGD